MRDQWNAWGDSETDPVKPHRDGMLSLLWLRLRRLGPTRPTAIDDHEGQIRYERDGDVTGTMYLGRYVAGGTYEWKDLTSAGGALTVQEGDADVDTNVTTIDFNASQFNVTSSPAGEVNVSLAGSSATIDVQEATVSVSTASAINFDGTDFNVSDSPAGTANVSLNYGTTANVPAEGNHTHAGSGLGFDEVQRLIAIGAPL